MKTIFTFMGVLFAASNLFAFDLSPMEKDFAPTGPQTTQTFFLQNKSPNPVAIDIKMYKRSLDPSGKEIRKSTNDFLIFPKTVKLNGNEKRAVRVTWRGSSNVTSELAYRLVAEQLNIGLEKIKTQQQGVNIRYMFTFVASIYVTPAVSKSNVQIQSAKAQNGELKIFLQNKGNRHHILNTARLFVNSAGQRYEISKNEMKQVHQSNLLANSGQYIVIKQPNLKGPVLAEIQL